MLVRVLGAVARLLAFFVLPITADKTQEGVVCQGTEKDEGVERVGGIEENEREVNEGVTQVTEQSFSMVIQTWVAYPKGDLLWMSHNAPHPVTTQISPFLTVQFQLCIRQSFHRESSAKEAHAQCPQRTRNLRRKRNR